MGRLLFLPYVRRLILSSLIVCAAACDFGRSTRPALTVISVRVLDDRGMPAGRNPVIVTQSATALVSAQTDSDGAADISLRDSGVYRVSIVPRAGFIGGADSLVKSVTVAAHTTVTVNFTLYRIGLVPTDPTAELPIGR